ncbi:MAG: hypothetical protein DYH08_06325 [Actinobacteria bacterium ATB1]|nr:hypothetical protein [Actinobacteria bacterium ATB1]
MNDLPHPDADSPAKPSGLLLLCDAAEAIGGKLYLLGAGWSRQVLPEGHMGKMALAIRIKIPWNMANTKLDLEMRLVTSDGEPVLNEDNQEVKIVATVEVGRPPGLAKGTPLDFTAAVDTNVTLDPKQYEWQLRLGGELLAREQFSVERPPG